MPKVRTGYRQLATQIPEELMAGLEALTERTGRSLAVEVAAAVRRHLAKPPRVIEVALDGETVKKSRRKPA